jgi:hypothetical protein
VKLVKAPPDIREVWNVELDDELENRTFPGRCIPTLQDAP